MHELLSSEQMQNAERYLYARGTQSFALMRRAGEAVADCVIARYPDRPVLVIAGPGNNGGDGFIAAEVLRAKGRDVSVMMLTEKSGMGGDAARAAAAYKGKSVALDAASLEGNPVIVDALFGTGLTRPVTGAAAQVVKAINAKRMDVVAVDIPSGVHGNSGEVLGVAPQAAVTVTFARKKYAHALMPGRALCGEIILADIGVNDAAVASVKPMVFENCPDLWRAKLPWPKPQNHKYDRGSTLVVGGPALKAGAAKLAALASLRTGSGLATIVCNPRDVKVYAESALSLMTETFNHWQTLLKDARRNTVLIGPGAGANIGTRTRVLSALKEKKRMVLDADALTAFAKAPRKLFAAVKSPCILTPHEGEFARLFGKKLTGSKLQKTLNAAILANAVVVLKGYDTVIAAPDGRAAINTNAPASLATAGAGDVLAGICAGWLAQGMDAFDAACSAVWIHGEAAKARGTGLIAEDLLTYLPGILENLKGSV